MIGGEDYKEFENKPRRHSIQKNKAALLIYKWCGSLAMRRKYDAEKVEDMTNVASEIGSTMYVSKAIYMINRKET